MFPWFLSRKTLRFNLGLQIGIAEGVLAPHRGKVGPHLLNTKNAGFHGTPFWLVYIHICMQIFMFAYIYHYIVHWYIFSYHIYTQMYNYHEYIYIYKSRCINVYTLILNIHHEMSLCWTIFTQRLKSTNCPSSIWVSDPFKIASNLNDILLKHDVCIYTVIERESYILT